MTREDKLYSMRMVELAEVAEKLGIKIDKKGSKSKAIEKILAAEASAPAVKPEKKASKSAKPVANDDVAGDGTPIAEVGKEIAEQAKQKSAKAKSEKKQKTVKEKVDTIAIVESLCQQMKLQYKRSRDGIGIFSENKRVLDIWRRSDKIRVYVSSENPKFKKIDKKIVLKLSDNPSKSSKLDKSFYVECANIETLLKSFNQ